jgi:hypothetical protein
MQVSLIGNNSLIRESIEIKQYKGGTHSTQILCIISEFQIKYLIFLKFQLVSPLIPIMPEKDVDWN